MLRWFHRQTGDTRGTLPCPAFPSGRVRPGLGTADQPLYASSPAEASGCHWKDAPWGGEEAGHHHQVVAGDLLGVQGRGDLLEERLSCPGPSGSGGSIPGGRRGVNVDRVGMLDDHLVGGKFEVGAGRSFLFGHANSVLMPRLEVRHDPGYLIPRGGNSTAAEVPLGHFSQARQQVIGPVQNSDMVSSGPGLNGLTGRISGEDIHRNDEYPACQEVLHLFADADGPGRSPAQRAHHWLPVIIRMHHPYASSGCPFPWIRPLSRCAGRETRR